MIWTIRKEELASKLQLIGGLIGRKQTLPILSHILWQVHGDRVKITAADMEMELTTEVDLEGGDREGQTTFPGKKFMDIIRSAPAESVIQIDLQGERAEIRYTQNRFTLTTLPANQFPVMQLRGEYHDRLVPQDKLKWLIGRTQFSIAKEEVRYYLSSLLLEVKNNWLRTTSSDSHRLSYAECVCDGEGFIYEGEDHILLSRRAIMEIDRLLTHSTEKISLRTTNENFFQLQTEHAIFTTKRVEGKVPRYQNAFLDEVRGCMTVEREEFKQALVRAAIVSYSDESTVQLKIIPGKLVILAGAGGQENADIEVPTDYSGESFEVVFNVLYLLEALSVLDKRTLRLSWSDPSAGMIIEEVGSEASCYSRHMIMSFCE
ncbi:MAG: DNA polymerase III subunit beta [Gammaproteobacteria bacterium]|nr:DNA polymerase III subunit beta [Gammaproteobacteria bacterium]